MKCCVALFCFALFAVIVFAAKQRSWIGPNNFFEGTISKRSYFSIAGIDEKVYLFGGYDDDIRNDLFVIDPVALTSTDLSHLGSGKPPIPRLYFGYTSAGGNLYVFGGNIGSEMLNDLYIFDPFKLSWTDLSAAAGGTPPVGRAGAGLAAVGLLLYVHAGFPKSGQRLDDLFAFDLAKSAWIDLSTPHAGVPPEPRNSHGFVEAGGKLYVHGGLGTRGEHVFADSDTINSRPGSGSACDYAWGESVSTRGTFGMRLEAMGEMTKVLASGYLADLQAYDPATRKWTDLSGSASGSWPSARFLHGFAAAGGRIYVFGGISLDGPVSDHFQFDLVTSTWSRINSSLLSLSQGFGFASLSTDQLCLCYSVDLAGPLDNFHLFNITTKEWTLRHGVLKGDPSPARHKFGFAEASGKFYAFAGKGADSSFLSSMLVFNPVELAWSDVSNRTSGGTPSPRSDFGFALAGNKLYVHGGYNPTAGCLDDIFVFDPSNLSWAKISEYTVGPSPSPRYRHGFTSSQGILYVFGGRDGTGVLNDFYALNPANMTWINLSSSVSGALPGPRCNFGFASAGGKLFVFGGESPEAYFNDLHSFSSIDLLWRDLSSMTVGPLPTPRSSFGFTSAGEKLYLYGGFSFAGSTLSGLFIFDYPTLTWSDISSSVRGNSPLAKSYFNIAVADRKLYLFGGANEEGIMIFDHLMALTLQKDKIWPSQIGSSWFIDVFDWDTIIIDSTESSRLSIALDLCSSIFPCTFNLQGKPSGFVLQSKPGYISCFFSAGCLAVTVKSINFSCSGEENEYSIFKIRGSNLTILDSQFSNCVSRVDGGIVQSVGNSSIEIESCIFQNNNSSGFGGAVSAFGGYLSIENSHFENCFSQKGGGAVWVSAYRLCYGLPQSFSTNVLIESTTFYECSSGSAGGAILASGEASSRFESMTVMAIEMISNIFVRCQSTLHGGALSVAGPFAFANLISSMFVSCSAGSNGGAISSSQSSTISLFDTCFKDNFALGIGGGALYLRDNRFMTFNSSFYGNAAPNGGGGALLWQGSVSQTGIGCPKGMKYFLVPCMMTSQSSDCSWATCAPCDIGTYKSDAGMSDCKACTAGTYAELMGSVSCIGCPAGYFANVSGAYNSAACTLCNTGSFSLPGASVCFLCPMGTFSFEYGSTECSICSPGKFLALLGANTSSLCEPCGYGQFSGAAASTCSDCMFSTFSDRIASTSCQRCTSGHYTSVLGASSTQSCVSCGLGQYVSSGSSQCSLCISSVYSDDLRLYQDLSDIEKCAITALNGSIGRFVENGKYGNNEKIIWLIRQPSFHYFTLEFTDFEVESDYDFVSMYACEDEACIGNKQDARFFSNKLYPGAQEFFAVAVLVIWSSDGAFSHSGWRADYRVSKEPLPFSRPSLRLVLENPQVYPADNTTTSNNVNQIQLAAEAYLFREIARVFADGRSSITSSLQPAINRRYITMEGNTQAFISTVRHHIIAVSNNAHQENHLRSHVFVNLFKTSRNTRADLPERFRDVLCDDTNTALYGNCIASDYNRLLCVFPSSSQSMFWPGLTFDLTAVKVDAYNQTILTDSISHVDLLGYSGAADFLQLNSTAFVLVGSTTAKLEQGTGKISISIRPQLDLTLLARDLLQFRVHLILRGIDAESAESPVLMQSNVFSMNIRKGSMICPPGYVLQGAQETAACSFCSVGKYSLDPLAPAPGSISMNPECLNCPEGGFCGGGASVSFSVGKWEIEAGAYVLKSCPNGFQLVNSTDGKSHGIFSHDRQKCKQCLPGQYVIDPNIHECRTCPLGANCSDPSRPTFLIPGSEWISDGGAWALVGCPSGFFLDSGPQCTLCPAGFYCIGSSYPPAPCGVSQFSLPGASAQSFCKKSVFVIVAVNVPVLRFHFSEEISRKLNQALSILIKKSDEYIVLKSAEQSNTGDSTIVTSNIAAENESDADNIALTLDRETVQVALEAQGLSGSALLSIQMTACLPGFELSNSRTCQPCLEKYFCTGGTNVREACSAGLFSIAKANSSESCFYAVFVRFSFLVPVSQANYTESFRTKFRTSVSNVARIPIERVIISSFKTLSKRTYAFSGTIELEIANDNAESAAAVSSRLAPPDELNSQLISQGLPPGSLISISVTEAVQSTDHSSKLEWIIVGVTLGSLVVIVPILVRVLRRKESVEERTLQRALSELLLRLEVTRKNGFILNSERVPFWQNSRHFIFVQKCHAEAAARLSMFMDFDVNQFDAFCLCLEGDLGGYLIDPEISKKNLMGDKTRQYRLLCDWLLEIGIYLIRPEGVRDLPELTDTLNTGRPNLQVEMRFRFLVQKVLKARLWEDSEYSLFRRLQAAVAARFMEQIGLLCDHRFAALASEPGGKELISYHYPHAFADNNACLLQGKPQARTGHTRSSESGLGNAESESEPPKTVESDSASALFNARQDHSKVRAVVVYDLAMEEVNIERLQLAKEGNSHLGVCVSGLNEEVFLAQLHRRSLLLNKEFQDAVMEVVMCHVALDSTTKMAEALINRRASSSGPSSIEEPFMSNNRQLGWSRHILRSSSSTSASSIFKDPGGPPRSEKLHLGLASDSYREIQRKGSLMGTSDIFAESTDLDGPHGTQITCRFSDGMDAVEVFPAPIKTLARMQEKVLEYSAESASTAGGKLGNGWPQTARILDPIRSSIVCNGPAHILEAFQWFSEGCEGCSSKPICRFKNRFSFAKEELLGGCECTFRLWGR